MLRQNGFTPLFLLVAVGVLGTIALLIFQNVSLKQQLSGTNQTASPTSIPNNSLTVTPIPTTSNQTENWKLYSDNTFKISVLYPPTWDWEGISPNLIFFKPIGKSAPQGEYQVPGVFLRMLHYSYEDAINMALEIYGSQNQEDIKTPTFIGKHIWGTVVPGNQMSGKSGGIYILKHNDGNAFQLSYPVINGQSYQQEAKSMANSLKTLP
jgi:hypothetical protein